MKTFLVPVDFSPVSTEIIETAITFARAFGGRVFLLHAIHTPIITSEYALPVEAVQETMLASEQAARTNLAALIQRFTAARIEAEAVVRHDPPVSGILEEAARVRADFIIMGSHGHGKLYDLLVGSTASGVLKSAACGVIIMPPQDKKA